LGQNLIKRKHKINSDLEIQCPLNGIIAGVGSMEEVKNKKVLYHFAIFAIINELIIKNCRISST